MKIFIYFIIFVNLAVSFKVNGKDITEDDGYKSNICENELQNLESKIYFNVWLNLIRQKNEIGKLLKSKDLELGYQIENDKKYFISKNDYFTIDDVNTRFEYSHKTETLKIFLNIWNSKARKPIEFSDLPINTSRDICNDIITVLLNNYFGTMDDKNIYLMEKFIKYINFYFMLSPEEIEGGSKIGGIIYEKDDNTDSYKEIKTFDLVTCGSYEYRFVKKDGDCINL